MNTAPVDAPPAASLSDSPPESSIQSPTQSPTGSPTESSAAQPIVKSASAKPRRMDAFGRAECYMLAALCSTLIWIGLLAQAGSWPKWAELCAGLAGLAALCVYIVHWRWE